MADNMGRITILRARSQELESERPPDPPSRPSAVGHGSAPVQSNRHSNSRATEVSLDPTLFKQARDWSRLDWAIYWTALGCLLGTFWIVATVFM